MKKTTPIIFIFVLLINLSFLTAMFYPHGFHGMVTINDNQNPNGQILIGKINGVATGSCIISEGQYDLVIIDYIGNEGKIEFYIGEEKADESASFVIFEVTELDLTFDTIPLDSGDCGNDICDENECSSCAIDCGISDCVGNNRCDIEIGENCLTAPDDCACPSGYECINRICKKKDTDSSNDNDGDDSSNNGGNPIQQDSITNASDGQNDILSIESLNEADKEKATGPGITGAAIGFLSSGKGIITIILILVLGIGVIVLKKRSPKNE